MSEYERKMDASLQVACTTLLKRGLKVDIARVVDELADAIVRSEMQLLLKENDFWQRQDDTEYYAELKEAATLILAHYSAPGMETEDE